MSNSANADTVSSYHRNAQFWMTIIREGLDRYRTELTDNAVLAAIGDCAGHRILDAGCGEGYLSRMLHDRGASVVGVDSCDELVDAAREMAGRKGYDILHHRAVLDSLPLADQSVDCIVCNHVVNDLPDPAPAFREFQRVLAPGGKLVILMLHPCFYATVSGSNGKSEPDASDYFGVRTFVQQFRVAGLISPEPVRVWMRSLENYLFLLGEARFSLTSLREPRPSAEQIAADAWWRENFRRPLFMLLVAEKS